MRRSFGISIAISVLFFACGESDPEAEVVNAFFGAVQTGDQAGIERVSVTTFEGKPQSWEIVERGTESEAPFELAELEKQLQEKRNAVSAQRNEIASFLSDNHDTYEAYKAKYAEDPSAGFTGELAAFNEQLLEKQNRAAELQGEADQLAMDIEALENAATLSLSTPVDASFEGSITVKPLQVKVNDGSGEKTHTVVLHRYDLVDTRQDRTPTARWIVAEVEPQS